MSDQINRIEAKIDALIDSLGFDVHLQPNPTTRQVDHGEFIRMTKEQQNGCTSNVAGKRFESSCSYICTLTVKREIKVDK